MSQQPNPIWWLVNHQIIKSNPTSRFLIPDSCQGAKHSAPKTMMEGLWLPLTLWWLCIFVLRFYRREKRTRLPLLYLSLHGCLVAEQCQRLSAGEHSRGSRNSSVSLGSCVFLWSQELEDIKLVSLDLEMPAKSSTSTTEAVSESFLARTLFAPILFISFLFSLLWIDRNTSAEIFAHDDPKSNSRKGSESKYYHSHQRHLAKREFDDAQVTLSFKPLCRLKLAFLPHEARSIRFR